MQHGVNAHYVEVMTHCSGDAATRGFDLPAYLLKGMQRLLKYHPLLQQVKKRTAEDCHDAHAMLDEAMRLVEQHGLVVNEQVCGRRVRYGVGAAVFVGTTGMCVCPLWRYPS